MIFGVRFYLSKIIGAASNTFINFITSLSSIIRTHLPWIIIIRNQLHG